MDENPIKIYYTITFHNNFRSCRKGLKTVVYYNYFGYCRMEYCIGRCMRYCMAFDSLTLVGCTVDCTRFGWSKETIEKNHYCRMMMADKPVVIEQYSVA